MKRSNLIRSIFCIILLLTFSFMCFGSVKANAAGEYPEIKVYARFNGDSTYYVMGSSYGSDVYTGFGIAGKCSDAYFWNIHDQTSTITAYTTNPASYSDCVTLSNGKITRKTKAECEALHDDFGDDLYEYNYFVLYCDITLAEKDYPSTTFTVTIDGKDYVYTKAAGKAAKWPEVTKDQLLSGAKNGGKSISDLYTNVTLTKTTAANNSDYRYSNGTTTICFGSDALTLAFTATGTPKNGGGNGGGNDDPDEPEEPTGTATFTIIPEYGTAYSGKTYTFTPSSDAFLKKNDTITLDDIINGATCKNQGQNESFVSDGNTASDWIINTSNDKSKTYGLEDNDEFLKYDKNARSYKLIADLTEDKEVEIYLAPATVTISFIAKPEGELYDGYSSEFKVTNGSKTRIGFEDIAAGFRKETETEGEYDYLTDQVIVGGLTADYSKAYSSLAYEVNISGIRTTDLEPVQNVELDPVFTASTGYDPDSDSLYFESPVNLTLYWADAKKSAGVQLKGDKVNSLSMTKVTAEGGFYFKASLPLNDKDNGVKIAENKTAYIYVSTKAPAEEKTKYTGNYIVEATPYKKIAITFDYARADNFEEAEDIYAIASVTTTDTKKKTITYSGYTTEDHKNGLDAIIEMVQYSEDGTTWYEILENEIGKDKVNHDLSLKKLYELINSGSKTTLYFRIKGEAAREAIEPQAEDNPKTLLFDESVGRAASNAYRTSKAIKTGISPAKDGKAVKVDVVGGTLALKNGYDFVMTEKEKDTPHTTEAMTILPFNKAGKATRTINADGENKEVDTDIIPTWDYIPVKKVTDDASMFTSTKVKSYSIKKIVDECGYDLDGSGNLFIWIRKSATISKPADKWVLITLSNVTEAPVITKAKNADYYIAQDVEDTKGIIATPEVKNGKSDKNSGAYEYLIVDVADIVVENSIASANIDFTTAKWTTLNDKGLTVGKSSSKYSAKEGGKATPHVLKEGSAVLVRRAGDKSSNILASDYLVTMVVKQDVTYKDADNKEQTKTLFVWKPYVVAE